MAVHTEGMRKTIAVTRVQCPSCNGSGYEQNKYMELHSPCPSCDTSGYAVDVDGETYTLAEADEYGWTDGTVLHPCCEAYDCLVCDGSGYKPVVRPLAVGT